MHILETQGNQKGQVNYLIYLSLFYNFCLLKVNFYCSVLQIAVMFHEKRTKKAWFSRSEEEVCWEQWAVTINTVICRTEGGKYHQYFLLICYPRYPSSLTCYFRS